MVEFLNNVSTGSSFFFDLYISEYLAYVLVIWNLIYADINTVFDFIEC